MPQRGVRWRAAPWVSRLSSWLVPLPLILLCRKYGDRVMRWQNAAFRKVCEAFYPPTLPDQALTLNLSCGRLPSGQRSKTRTSAVRVTHAHTRKQPAHRGRLPDQAELERRILSYSATVYRRAGAVPSAGPPPATPSLPAGPAPAGGTTPPPAEALMSLTVPPAFTMELRASARIWAHLAGLPSRY